MTEAMPSAPAKPAKTLSTAWPAIRLPASRTEWLSGRTKYEMTSMSASTMRNASVGALATQKRFRKCAPCC